MKISDYLTVQQAADFLGIAKHSLRRWEKEKKIMTYRNPQNNYRLYKKEDLEQWLLAIKPKE